MAGRMKIFSLLVISLVIDKSARALLNLDPKWEELEVTYMKRSKMPLTRDEAELQGFQQIGGKDAPCEGTFFGYRYVKNDDPAVILLYDVNGYFAGIQTSYLEKAMTNSIVLNWFKIHPMFTVENLDLPGSNNKSKAYTLTAYLVDSTTICSTGRTKTEFDASKSGTNLYFKNGTENIAVPKRQTNLMGTSWTKGKCFLSMGVHYWYDISKDMNCDYFQPVFLLYNREKLTGFGWVVFGNFPSSRYEHPPTFSFLAFFERVPDCFDKLHDKTDGVSTQHVYMIGDPLNLLC